MVHIVFEFVGREVSLWISQPVTPQVIARFKRYLSQRKMLLQECYLTRWNEDTKSG